MNIHLHLYLCIRVSIHLRKIVLLVFPIHLEIQTGYCRFDIFFSYKFVCGWWHFKLASHNFTLEIKFSCGLSFDTLIRKINEWYYRLLFVFSTFPLKYFKDYYLKCNPNSQLSKTNSDCYSIQRAVNRKSKW